MNINLVVTGGFGISGGLVAVASDTVTRGYSFGAFVEILSAIARTITGNIASNIAYEPTEASGS